MLSYYFFLLLYSTCMIVLVILWLQSGFNKVKDFNGNLEWLTGQFSKTPFRNIIKPLLMILTMLEIITGMTALMAILELWILKSINVSLMACFFSIFTLTLLFMGQRISKEYAGAAGVVNYLIYMLLLLGFTFIMHTFILPFPDKLHTVFKG